MARKSSYIINRRNTELWKKDTIQSISLYNDWFLNFAPATYTKERRRAMEQVGLAISQTNNFHFTTTHLKEHPELITILRMATTPPIARERLMGFSGVKPSFIKNISDYLVSEGYTIVDSKDVASFSDMESFTFTYHLNVPVKMRRLGVNMPIDVVIKRMGCNEGTLPLLVECKSAGDFTNTNKRRKEEAQKIEQLKNTYGNNIDLVLFLCGYFDSGYLGYEAAEGIDWIWEHRVTDFKKAGV